MASDNRFEDGQAGKLGALTDCNLISAIRPKAPDGFRRRLPTKRQPSRVFENSL